MRELPSNISTMYKYGTTWYIFLVQTKIRGQISVFGSCFSPVFWLDSDQVFFIGNQIWSAIPDSGVLCCALKVKIQERKRSNIFTFIRKVLKSYCNYTHVSTHSRIWITKPVWESGSGVRKKTIRWTRNIVLHHGTFIRW